jgi:isoquinoline 1-oxidoreductase/isoquinoline 1-oxidoreductase beta subunit
VENGKIRVHKVTCVLDCGLVVNPDIVRSQIEGGVIYGLTATLYGGLNLEAGAIKESNFHDYPMLRMSESPEIEVVIIDSGTKPTGVGEPGLPPIAPAVANAVYKATGQRLRSLPLQLAKDKNDPRWCEPPRVYSIGQPSRPLDRWRNALQPIHCLGLISPVRGW